MLLNTVRLQGLEADDFEDLESRRTDVSLVKLDLVKHAERCKLEVFNEAINLVTITFAARKYV